MITLTSAQEAIVKDDETVKNFVVHFPNGERADLSNSDIVFESVKFTESVCSDQSFRFGGADASCIEFETVGVGNIIGLTIECSMIFSLSGSTVTIPYGTFIVDSCPRDHASMVHRKVTAYTASVNNNYLSEYEEKKLANYYTSYEGEKYTPTLTYLLEETFGFMSGITHSETTETGSSGSFTRSVDLGTDNDGYTVTATCSGTVHRIYTENALYKNTETVYDDTFRQNLLTLLETDGMEDQYGLFRFLYGMGVNNVYINELYDPSQLIYPYIRQNSTPAIAVYSNITVQLSRSLNGTTEQLGNISSQNPWTVNGTPGISLKKYKISSGTGLLPILSFSTTLKHTYLMGGVEQTAYSFANTYSLADIAQGYAELNAGFFRANRDGTASLIHLDNSSPYALTASDVEGSAWWDEYTIEPIGTIHYTYTDPDSNETMEKDYVFNESNPSYYDMSNNYLVKNMSLQTGSATSVADMTDITKMYIMGGDLYYYNGTGWASAGEYVGVAEIIETMFDAYFIPYASTVNFVPLDATFRGMPYLQCGDAITLTAADGTVISSYLLKQTFDGIQHISQDVETVQGTVIGSEVTY